ncbi:uncharacterized protein BDZ83DRAFT_638257 [Colletotrichum acutatum]|uniref:Uncharacterized protein n=1 Tax=Glomerella acutata TaxID=27357 RepID=A0AAD8XAU6_GLOAC|nr:uncharacterized protein BDZ83DRAFT_638257 [Colletotrichum acutatum]KAK1712900.1 hypothetical protein BDZ83DRAFT_638257 [Colletotrichum acutatum]
MWLSRFAASATFLVPFQRWTPAAAGKGLFWRGTDRAWKWMEGAEEGVALFR